MKKITIENAINGVGYVPVKVVGDAIARSPFAKVKDDIVIGSTETDNMMKVTCYYCSRKGRTRLGLVAGKHIMQFCQNLETQVRRMADDGFILSSSGRTQDDMQFDTYDQRVASLQVEMADRQESIAKAEAEFRAGGNAYQREETHEMVEALRNQLADIQEQLADLGISSMDGYTEPGVDGPGVEPAPEVADIEQQAMAAHIRPGRLP